MDPIVLAAVGVSFRYPKAERYALIDVSLQVGPGELVAVVGPNGSGKSTLLRLALGTLTPESGSVQLGHRLAGTWPRRELARFAAMVSQREEVAFPLKVRDATAFGRYPYLSAWGGERKEDRVAVEGALARCDATMLADRWVHTLSGGEWQRVRIARALAQAPQLLLLDEPTTSLDIRHEMELFTLLDDLAHRSHLAVVLVTHHLNLAARFADRILILSEGREAAQGTPGEVVRAELLERVFGWPVGVVTFEDSPQFLPRRMEGGGATESQ